MITGRFKFAYANCGFACLVCLKIKVRVKGNGKNLLLFNFIKITVLVSQLKPG